MSIFGNDICDFFDKTTEFFLPVFLYCYIYCKAQGWLIERVKDNNSDSDEG